MARLHPDSYGNQPLVGGYEDFRAQMKAQDEERQAALDRYAETGDLKGYFYTHPYADSYAVYRVVSLRPFTVQHVHWGDGWQLPAAHIRGLTVADVKAHADQQLAWRELLATRKG